MFQWDMSYSFHEIKHILQEYLYDLLAHLNWLKDHSKHLHAIFIRYRHYKIWLDLHNFIFFVEAGHCLGFIVSKYGIWVDLLKVEAILNFPPPRLISELQSL